MSMTTLPEIQEELHPDFRSDVELSGGVEAIGLVPVRRNEGVSPKPERHAALPCKHGDVAKDGLMASAHSLVQPNNVSEGSDSPTQLPVTGNNTRVHHGALNGEVASSARSESDSVFGADQQRRIAGVRTPTVKTQALPRSNADEAGGVTAGETAFPQLPPCNWSHVFREVERLTIGLEEKEAPFATNLTGQMKQI